MTAVKKPQAPRAFSQHEQQVQINPHQRRHGGRGRVRDLPCAAEADQNHRHRDELTKSHAMLRIKQLPTFDSVAAGKKAVVDLPLGLRYHAIWLTLGNNAVAANAITDLVDDIVVKVNGKPQRTHTGRQLNELNSVNGSAYALQAEGTNGQADRRLYLPIYFAEPWRKVPEEVHSLALRANGIQSLQVEVNVKAGLASPIVTGWYEFDYDNRDIGMLSKFIRQDYSAVGTSRDIVTIDKRDFIESVHFFPTSDSKQVTEVKVTANGEEIRDRVTYSQNLVLLAGRELTPVAGNYDLVFDYDDPINGALPTQANGRPINELTFKVTWASAANGTQTVIIKRTGPPE